MTNLQSAAPQRLTRERVLLWSPVLLGTVMAITAAGALMWPALQHLQQQQTQLADLKEQEARIPLMRQQVVKQQENLEQAQLRERRILQLIAGSGDISTFMAQLGHEARRSGVQLDSYEPVTTTAAPATAASAQPAKPATPPGKADANQPPPPPPDPLLAPGLQKTSLLIAARGQGPQLLDFLRRLERLSLLVAQSDLSLKVEPAPGAEKGKVTLVGNTVLKLNLSLYSKVLGTSGSSETRLQPAGTPEAAKS